MESGDCAARLTESYDTVACAVIISRHFLLSLQYANTYVYDSPFMGIHQLTRAQINKTCIHVYK